MSVSSSFFVIIASISVAFVSLYLCIGAIICCVRRFQLKWLAVWPYAVWYYSKERIDIWAVEKFSYPTQIILDDKVHIRAVGDICHHKDTQERIIIRQIRIPCDTRYLLETSQGRRSWYPFLSDSHCCVFAETHNFQIVKCTKILGVPEYLVEYSDETRNWISSDDIASYSVRTLIRAHVEEQSEFGEEENQSAVM